MAEPRTKARARRRPTGSKQRAPSRARARKAPWYKQPQIRTWGLLLILAAVIVGAVLASRDSAPQQSSPATPVVGGDLHSLVVDPTDPSRLFIGSHSGVSVSNDSGETWKPVESLGGADAMGWAFTDEAILVGGHPGLYVSTDGGTMFKPRNEGLPSTDIHALGAGEGVIYAASPAAGFMASTDGGETWSVQNEQHGRAFMGRILVDPADPQHVIAPDMQVGAAESTDGGRTWDALGGVEGAMWVTWDPADISHLIVTAPGSTMESTDGGESWASLETPKGASIVEMDPQDPQVLYAAVLDTPEAHVFVSTNGGKTWSKP